MLIFLLKVFNKEQSAWTHANNDMDNAVTLIAYSGNRDALDVLMRIFSKDNDIWKHTDTCGNNAVLVATKKGRVGTLDFLLQTFGPDHGVTRSPRAPRTAAMPATLRSTSSTRGLWNSTVPGGHLQ